MALKIICFWKREEKNRVIFPDAEFKPLETAACYLIYREKEPGVLLNWCATTIRDNRRLVPRTEEGRFYLAKHYLWRHEYALAASYLTGWGGQLRPLSQKQFKLLSEIADLNSKNSDADPVAVSLRLKAFALLLKNEQDFGVVLNNEGKRVKADIDENFRKKLLETDYPRYLNNLDYSGMWKLNQEEEILILAQLASRILWDTEARVSGSASYK